MKIGDILRKYGAYLAAAFIFVFAAYAYCSEELSGKVLLSVDDVNALSAVHEAQTFDKSEGEYGFWNGSMFSGMPNYQIGGGHYRSSELTSPWINFLHRGPKHPAWILIFYFVCFFTFLRCFGVDKWLSIAGAFAIALSSYFIVIIAAGHGGKTISISYITLVAAGFYLVFRKKYSLGAIFTMFFSAAGFSIHPQMAYYLFLMIGVFFLAELWIHIKEKRYKDLAAATGIFAIALAIGLGTGCSNIFANSEYASQTMRGGHSDLVKDGDNGRKSGLDIEYATQWSYGIDETLSFLIPGVKGGSSSYPLGNDSYLYGELVRHGVPPRSAADFCANAPMYWGEQPFTAGNVYMGAVVCLLFILGLVIVKGPYKWAILIATLFSIALAWGHNCLWLTELFFDYFPLYNKFRAVSSILIVAEITMPLLGFLAVKQLMDGQTSSKDATKAILVSGGIAGGICLIAALLGGSLGSFVSASDAAFSGQLPEWAYAALVKQRADLLRSDSWRSLFFIAATVVLLLLYNKGKIKNGMLAATLGILIVADMWPVDRRYFNDSHFISPRERGNAFAIQPYEEMILEDPDPHFRVLNLCTNPFNDARTSYRLKSIGGYSAAKLRRYQDLIDEHLSKVELPVIGMLNAKYLITEDEDGRQVPVLNQYALGNAWFVEKIVVADGAQEESDALSEIDLSTTAVIDKEFAPNVGNLSPGRDPGAKVELVKYLPRKIDYRCTSSIPGTIIFSEIYYPYGWKASIDGIPAGHFRANYTLRGLNVPEGEHEITFEFDPDSVKKGDAIATACIILMYGLTAAAIAKALAGRFRRKKEDGAEN